MKMAITVKRLSIAGKPFYTHTLRAFTLVELMFVLAILSILLSLAIPNYQSITQKAQRTEGQALLLDIQSQLERYYLHR